MSESEIRNDHSPVLHLDRKSVDHSRIDVYAP